MPDFTTDDGVRLHYNDSGNGLLPIIFLHWMGGDAGSWEALWAAIGNGAFRHIGLDFRGHGRSERKPSTFSNERLARDVLQLADVLRLSRFVIAGHSFGGKVALLVSALAPARVAGLILLGAVGPAKVQVEREAVEPILKNAGDIDFVREAFRSWFLVWPRPELARWTGNFVQTPVWAHRSVCEIALWTDITSEISKLDTPALVVAGRHDPAYGPEYQQRSVLPVLRCGRMVCVDCGHGLGFEKPEEIAQHSGDFLRTLLLA